MYRTVGARRIGEGVLLGTWLVLVLAALLGAPSGSGAACSFSAFVAPGC